MDSLISFVKFVNSLFIEKFSNMKSIVLFGSGGHCKSCIEIIENSREFKIKGIVVKKGNKIKSFMDYKVLGNDDNLRECLKKDDSALICVGQIKSPDKRIELFDFLKKHKIEIATLLSNSSIISKNSYIGQGTAVMHRVIINSGAKVGINCILNTSSLIEHDVNIGDHCHISTGVIINGEANIGDGCFIGSGSIIREGVNIGDRSIISAGQVVMRDIPNNSVIKF